LWLLSRTPQVSQQTRERLLEEARSHRYSRFGLPTSAVR
ncbi:lipocalin family protein, partial [Pseudomonas aeruginosa]|nr:lipocalin family protein [Pseudomonas aeruginosa]